MEIHPVNWPAVMLCLIAAACGFGVFLNSLRK